MADESNKVKQILDQIESLKKQLLSEQNVNRRLNKDLETKDAELKLVLKRLSDLQTENDNLTLAGWLSATDNRRKTAKRRLTEMVQEINKCLALLNQT